MLYVGIKFDKTEGLGVTQALPSVTIAQLESSMNRFFNTKKMYTRYSRRRRPPRATTDVSYAGDGPSTESSAAEEPEHEELRLKTQPAHDKNGPRKPAKARKLRVASSFLTAASYRLADVETELFAQGFSLFAD